MRVIELILNYPFSILNLAYTRKRSSLTRTPFSLSQHFPQLLYGAFFDARDLHLRHTDDAADLLEEMPANIVKKLLTNASPEVRRDINHLLRYPEDSAGSIMTVEYVDLKENLTVNQAIERIRKVGLDSETINICYVLDAQRRLVGTVALRYLLLMDGDEIIGDIMHENVISINTLMDQEEVARQFKKYDFTAMPVVDNENRLVGIITVDDIVDIIEEETTEDMEKMAAIVPSDKPYMKTGVFETFKKRIPWLLLLMVSATFTGAIISSFEDALSVCAVLVAYIPMLMDTGGNCGSQASVTVIRGMALDEIRPRDILSVIWKEIRVSVIRGLSLNEIEYRDVPKVVFKEIRVALICGITLSAANFAKLLLLDKVGVLVAASVCLTLVAAVVIAMIIGCLLPILAKRLIRPCGHGESVHNDHRRCNVITGIFPCGICNFRVMIRE